MSNFFSQAWARLSGETPTFFKKVRATGNSLMATGTAAIATQIVPQVKMPPALISIGSHAIVAGFIMTLVASFACKDTNDPTAPKS